MALKCTLLEFDSKADWEGGLVAFLFGHCGGEAPIITDNDEVTSLVAAICEVAPLLRQLKELMPGEEAYWRYED